MKGPVKCFICNSSHMVRGCPKKYMFYAIKKDDVLDNTIMRLGLIVHSAKVKRNHKQKGLMYVDINIAGQRRRALIDIRASNLFILGKAMGKLGLSISKMTKKIKTLNFDESAKKAPLEMLERQRTDMLPVELSVGLPHMREVGCASKFGRKVVNQTGQLEKVNATGEVHLKYSANVLHSDLPLAW
ncbi:hypothetical protein J1N35_004833 [Gossypium stocksii]|uniref:Uncharacterized protein n=1 Tax=Gossypium stocksii TaxID=47602 RepID=A0A9D3WED8_9ROSI|nr:hypothetical protein J1N35_004833 [Gossypium stocksii]